MKFLLYKKFNDRLKNARILENAFYKLREDILFNAAIGSDLKDFEFCFNSFENYLQRSGVIEKRGINYF